MRIFFNKNFKSKKYYCSVCDTKVNDFRPLSREFRKKVELSGFKYFGQNEHINIEKYLCPKCGATDRDRLYAAYFNKFFLTKELMNNRLLHVAPSESLNNLYLKNHFKVTTTDLYMKNVDYIMDIEDMFKFDNNTFDFFICSHVLEHVYNPKIALEELLRVLKVGGKGIIMAPINPYILTTLENPEHVTEEERLKNYGQEDHLRLFSKSDFIKLIKAAGFEIKMLGIRDFGKKEFATLGLNPSTILYIGLKQ